MVDVSAPKTFSTLLKIALELVVVGAGQANNFITNNKICIKTHKPLYIYIHTKKSLYLPVHIFFLLLFITHFYMESVCQEK